MASLRDLGYEEIRNIGRGQYGVVRLVRCLEEKMLYVCKTIDLTCRPKAEREAAQQEVGLLKSLDHPNIVRYKDSFVIGDAIIIAMQYCEDGDLAAYIKDMTRRRMRIKEQTVMSFLVQTLHALEYLHGRRILHRDLKSSNLFLTDKGATVKLGDFGIAKVLNGTMQAAMSVVGTPHYMSPEVCENRPYNHKSDIWSLGCVVYELCMLKHAFAAANLLGLVSKIVREKFEPIPPMYSAGLNNLVQRMLAKGANSRPSVRSILEDKHVQQFLRSHTHKKDATSSLTSRGPHSDGEGAAGQGPGGQCHDEPPPDYIMHPENSVGVPTDSLSVPLESSQEASTNGNATANGSGPEPPEPAAAWPSPQISPHLDTAAALLEDSEEYEESVEYEDDFCSEDQDEADLEEDDEEMDSEVEVEEEARTDEEAPPRAEELPSVPSVPSVPSPPPPPCSPREVPAPGLVATPLAAEAVPGTPREAAGAGETPPPPAMAPAPAPAPAPVGAATPLPAGAKSEAAVAGRRGAGARAAGARTVVGRRVPQAASVPKQLSQAAVCNVKPAASRGRVGRGAVERTCRSSTVRS